MFYSSKQQNRSMSVSASVQRHQYQCSASISAFIWKYFHGSMVPFQPLFLNNIKAHISKYFCQTGLIKTEYKSQTTMNVLGKTLTFTQKPSFQFTQWQILVQSNRDNQPTNESKLYILYESPKCLFSNLKPYLIGKHALMAIDCCTGSKQQNS